LSSRNTPTAGYESAVSGALTFAGVDQGIDFTGTGTIHALGDAIVERVVRAGSGWPGRGALLVYQLTSGPRAGQRVYVAEDYTIAPGITRGTHLKAGQAIGTVHSSYPGIEMGFATASGTPVAPLNPNPHSPKAAGREFDAFVRGLAGAAPAGSAASSSSSAGTVSTADLQAAGCASMLGTTAIVLAAILFPAFFFHGWWPF
jgi:hypothetical protein